jgi:hypothetical protein
VVLVGEISVKPTVETISEGTQCRDIGAAEGYCKLGRTPEDDVW